MKNFSTKFLTVLELFKFKNTLTKIVRKRRGKEEKKNSEMDSGTSEIETNKI